MLIIFVKCNLYIIIVNMFFFKYQNGGRDFRPVFEEWRIREGKLKLMVHNEGQNELMTYWI